jgi:hypothetical protein
MEKKRRQNTDEREADDVLKQLCLSLRLLASDAQTQITHFAGQPVVITDEMALDFDNWVRIIQTYWDLSEEQNKIINQINAFLDRMSEKSEDSFWTDEALFTDEKWEEVRKFAKEGIAALKCSVFFSLSMN